MSQIESIPIPPLCLQTPPCCRQAFPGNSIPLKTIGPMSTPDSNPLKTIDHISRMVTAPDGGLHIVAFTKPPFGGAIRR